MNEKVLVLDDDKGISRIMAINLKQRHYEPIISNTLEEATAQLKDHPEITKGVVDYNLHPDAAEGGPYSTAVIRTIMQRPGARVVLLSATDDSTGGKAQLVKEFGSRGLAVGTNKFDFSTVDIAFTSPDRET